MIVESFRKSGEFREFNPETGKMECGTIQAAQDVRNTGQYCPLKDVVAILYRIDDRLWLSAGADNLAIDEVSRVSRQPRGGREFSLNIDVGERRYSWNYHTSVDPGSDLTSFATYGEGEEDFDFGLCLYTIINDTERQKRMYSYWWLD